MEPSGVRDCLQVVVGGEIRVASRYRWKLPLEQSGDGRLKCVAKVRVACAAPIPRVVRGIDRELHEVRQPADLLSTGGLAAGQSPELLEAHPLSALRRQVC